MFKKIKHTIKDQLTQGVSPEKLSQSLLIGILIGCFPMLGVTTVLALIVGGIFKLNHIVMQAIGYLVYPVQLILIPIYIKAVSVIIDIGDLPIRPDLIIELFYNDPWGSFVSYGEVTLYAIVLWFVLSIPLYFIFVKSLTLVIAKFSLKK